MTTLPAKGTFLHVIAGPEYWAIRAMLKREVWALMPMAFGGRVIDYGRAEEFARRYRAGETYAAIGKTYNISGQRVRAVLRKVGVPSLGYRPRGRRPLTDREGEALRLYSAGVPAPAIYERLGISPSRLTFLRHREGVPAKGAGFFNRRPDDAELTTAIVRLYLSGMGPSEIARTLPQIRFPEQIYRYLKRAGVQPRSRRGRFRKPIPCPAPSRTDGTGGIPPPVSGAGNSRKPE